MRDAQIVYNIMTEDKGYTDENSLNAAYLTKPDTLNAVVTHLGGRESEKFPMQFLTEGQKGGTDFKNIKEIDDAQFTWDVTRRKKQSDFIVVSSYVNGDTPGLKNSTFTVIFSSKWLIEQHQIVSRSGTKAIIVDYPRKVASGYEYTLKLSGVSASAYCPVSDLEANAKWAMISPGLVSESDSRGNRSNRQFPGKFKNQLSFMRKSFAYGGNVANKSVEVHFMTSGGRKTMKWLPYEEWQFNMEWREAIEEHLWESVYNRNEQGEITTFDVNSGKPIPTGAGILDQIPNNETYGELTYKKLNDMIGDVAYGATDTDQMQIILYAGKGFLRDFDEAIKNKSLGLTQIIGDKFVKGEGRNLVLTGFFRQFEHVDGHTIIVKHLPMLDLGGRSEVAERHPITGFPMTSHEAIFIDQSNYDGERNVKMVAQKGRSILRGMLKGMAPTGNGISGLGDFKGNAYMATDQDRNSIHFFSAKAVNISRNEHCLRLQCDLS